MPDDVDWPDASLAVSARVCGEDPAGTGGLRTEVVDRNVAGDVVLAGTTSDGAGRYTVSLPPEPITRQGKTTRDLQVRVSDGATVLGASEVRYDATPQETLDVVLGSVLPTTVPDTGGKPKQLAGLTPPAAAGRGVLDGAFAVLDALAHADEGLGLTALARVSGLAKTSAHRLAEQLVTLGAVQCAEHRYYVGPRMLRIGQRWQPDPLLRRCAQAPIHTLAVQSRAAASLRILHEHRLRYVCAAVPHGHAHMPDPADPESIARTATGRVLYATQPGSDVTLPDCWTRREWRRLRESLRDPRATVIDHQDAVAGICCVSAPVWWPNGSCAGAVTVTVQANDLPVGLPTLVSHTARRIGAALQHLKPK